MFINNSKHFTVTFPIYQCFTALLSALLFPMHNAHTREHIGGHIELSLDTLTHGLGEQGEKPLAFRLVDDHLAMLSCSKPLLTYDCSLISKACSLLE